MLQKGKCFISMNIFHITELTRDLEATCYNADIKSTDPLHLGKGSRPIVVSS